MQYINDSEFHLKNAAVALGKFEGLHRGHQLLFDAIKEQEHKGQKSVVFTFDMPPRASLLGDTDYRQIFTREERRIILEDMQMDVLIEHPFTKTFAAQSPENFVKNVLVEKVGAKTIVVGKDFRFGKNRTGDVELLSALSSRYGYDLIVVKKLKTDLEDVSSSRIRGHIEKGEMKEAERLLGRPYAIWGRVVHGQAFGRTISIPTANVPTQKNKLLPPNGVYVSRIHIKDDPQPYYGITNLGVKPTVEEGGATGVETNLFDFHGDLYDKNIKVELLHYHRPEMRFPSLEMLRQQMEKDIAFGLSYAQKLQNNI